MVRKVHHQENSTGTRHGIQGLRQLQSEESGSGVVLQIPRMVSDRQERSSVRKSQETGSEVVLYVIGMVFNDKAGV